MGQKEIFDSLKSNPNEYFSAEELSQILKINRQSATASLNKLQNKGYILVKLFSIGRNNTPVKKFCFVSADKFESILNEFEQVREKNKYLNTETVSNLMILKELKEMNKTWLKKM